MLLRLALRNLLRNRARSTLTFVAIFFGVTMSIVLSGFGQGLADLMVGDAVYSKLGSIQIHRRGWRTAQDAEALSFDMPEQGELADRIRAVDGVVTIAPRLVFTGLVSNGTTATMLLGRGVDPVAELAALPWLARVIRGRFLTETGADGVVLGGDLATGLAVEPGSTLTLQAATAKGRQNAVDIELVGTLHNANILDSKRSGLISLVHAQRLLGMRGRVTEWVVRTARLDDVDVVAARLEAVLGSAYEVETWRTLQPSLGEIVALQRIVVGLVSAIFLVIVIFGIANTMVMSVMERVREIGTMMAVGLRRGRIATLFLVEALALGTLAGAAGVAAGIAVVLAVAAAGGVMIAAPGQVTATYGLVPRVLPAWVVAAFIGAAVGAAIAAVVPARRAASLRPVEALRAL